MARAAGSDEVEGIDEEFLFHVNRGSEMLVHGDAESARSSLERALELRPRDTKVLGLLGQAYYRLSRFDEAAKAWQRLVDDNPVEPSARVNLGLANLKAKRLADAVKQLEIAVDLNPEHRKAMGYLGLALLESGNFTRAREWFRKAGSDQMVARCDELIAGRSATASAGAPSVAAAAAAAAAAEDEQQPTLMPLHTDTEAAAPQRAPAPAGAVLAAWAAERIVSPAPGGTFSVSRGALSVTVHQAAWTRLDGLFASRGRVSMKGEMKRFRGRPTEKPFGDGPLRMHHVSGEGVLLYRAEGRRFHVLDLGPDAAYLREEVLFGFADGIAFENGRVPSSISTELNLVHLRGRGQFLLVTAGEPVAIDVTQEAPLKIPLPALIGWVGGLTPRVCPLLEEEGAPIASVELTGEGRVLADPAAGIGMES